MAIVISGSAAGSPSAPGDPSRGDNHGPTGVFDGAGASEPDPKTGIFTHVYTFDLPPARGPAQPRLSLHYSSATRRDREGGYGWGLGVSSIERRPMSGNPRFAGTAEDERFFFDGSPLVPICKLPCPKMGPHPQWSGWTFYRLANDTSHLRFYLSPDGHQWRVQVKDTGTQLDFGSPAGQVDGIEYVDGNVDHIVRWRLVRHFDVAHSSWGAPRNLVEYRWKRLGPPGSAPLLYLTDIYDTPRPEGGGLDVDFANHTELTWEEPGFPQAHYADAFHAGPSLRLSRVTVASMPWSGAGPRALVRRYWLRYYAPRGLDAYDAETRAPLWHHSFLREIQVEGAGRRCESLETDGHIPWTLVPQCPMQPPTTFRYEGGEIGTGAAFVSRVLDRNDLVEQRRVFSDEESVAILDFNRRRPARSRSSMGVGAILPVAGWLVGAGLHDRGRRWCHRMQLRSVRRPTSDFAAGLGTLHGRLCQSRRRVSGILVIAPA
ncbi:MAG TPA: SpvB/TcaC N-terminal domain-containing protein [Labilithrix sp.]|nr:SpvB/TcaC N-terminal domain-containing protein [Labilithrix sp.]